MMTDNQEVTSTTIDVSGLPDFYSKALKCTRKNNLLLAEATKQNPVENCQLSCFVQLVLLMNCLREHLGLDDSHIIPPIKHLFKDFQILVADCEKHTTNGPKPCFCAACYCKGISYVKSTLVDMDCDVTITLDFPLIAGPIVEFMRKEVLLKCTPCTTNTSYENNNVEESENSDNEQVVNNNEEIVNNNEEGEIVNNNNNEEVVNNNEEEIDNNNINDNHNNNVIDNDENMIVDVDND